MTTIETEATTETEAATTPLDRSGVWRLDPARSTLGFRIRKFFWHPKGRFEAFAATLERPVGEGIRASLRVEAASVRTGVGLRDAHLRTSHFLDARRHPGIAFESTSVEVAGTDRLRIRGNLEIKGVRRPYEIEAAVEAAERPARRPPFVEIAHDHRRHVVAGLGQGVDHGQGRGSVRGAE